MDTFNFPELKETKSDNKGMQSFDRMKDISLPVKYTIGTAKMTLEEADYFAKGTLLRVDTESHIPVTIEVGGRKVGNGRVEVTGEGEVFVRII